MSEFRPNFMAMLRSRWIEGKSVCVGLDSSYDKLPAPALLHNLPEEAVLAFNQRIVNATALSVCAFKPNIAFYSKKDANLRRALVDTCAYIRKMTPGVPIILDAKRGDIGNTNTGYVTEAFEEFDADAVTVNPYLGEEALKPFLGQKDKGIIILCRTSNPGAGEFQDRLTEITLQELSDCLPDLRQSEIRDLFQAGKYIDGHWFIPAYQVIALRVARYWNKNGNCALVVGATAPQELATVRQLVGDMPILVPGIGAQGGDLEATLKAGLTSHGDGLIINASRSVIFAASDHTYPEAAQAEVEKLNTAIRNFRQPQQKEKS